MRSLRDSVAAALAWRYACHSAMLGLSLLTEGRPAPPLPDLVLDRLPRIAWIADHNYWIWLLCYVPAALLLWRRDRPAFLHFLHLGGVLSLVRGLCVGLTGLGPAYGPDVNAGLSGERLFDAWLALINPFSTLFGNAAQVYLTKDLFFSGHVSTTFLLWLYCRGKRGLGTLAAAGHWVTVAVVLLSHLHYTIDVVGAWAVTYSLYALGRRKKAHPPDGQSDSSASRATSSNSSARSAAVGRSASRVSSVRNCSATSTGIALMRRVMHQYFQMWSFPRRTSQIKGATGSGSEARKSLIGRDTGQLQSCSHSSNSGSTGATAG